MAQLEVNAVWCCNERVVLYVESACGISFIVCPHQATQQVCSVFGGDGCLFSAGVYTGSEAMQCTHGSNWCAAHAAVLPAAHGGLLCLLTRLISCM